MELDWKGIVEKTIVAVMAGIILAGLAWIYAVSTSETKKAVVAEAEWIEVPNPVYTLDRKTALELDKIVGDNFGLTDLVSFMRTMSIGSATRISVLTIKNAGDTRTKDIDISAKAGAIFSSKRIDNGATVQSRIQLRPLDPKETALVYIVMPRWSFYETLPITVLNDGKLVELELKTLAGQEWEFLRSVNANKGWVAAGLFLAIIGGMTIVVTAISAVAYTFFKKQMLISTAKSAKPKALRYWLDLIEHVRANAPDRLAEAESLPSLLR